MKIAITASGQDLNSQVEARFGRCPYFLIIDTETMQFEALENPNIALGGGAGIQSAKLMAERGVQTVLTGNCGPNAFQTFGAAGIQVITGVNGIVREAVDQFKAGTFSISTGPNTASHSGMTTSPGMDTEAPSFNTMGTGEGMYRGMRGGGRGMGGGGGGGRGMCGGGGRGMGGGGRGMGMGKGMGAGMMGSPSANSPGVQQQPAGPMSRGKELEILKARAQAMAEELQTINEKIRNLKKN